MSIVVKRKWRIYYADRSIYEGCAENAPPWGVIDILQWNERAGKRYHTNQADYYLYDKNEGTWIGVDHIGLIDHMAHDGWVLVRMGRTISTHLFWEIYDRAHTDEF